MALWMVKGHTREVGCATTQLPPRNQPWFLCLVSIRPDDLLEDDTRQQTSAWLHTPLSRPTWDSCSLSLQLPPGQILLSREYSHANHLIFRFEARCLFLLFQETTSPYSDMSFQFFLYMATRTDKRGINIDFGNKKLLIKNLMDFILKLKQHCTRIRSVSWIFWLRLTAEENNLLQKFVK